MRCVPYSWREAYELALMEADPGKLVGRIEHSLNVLERRYSQWGIDPGTPAELMAIQKCISTLQRLMKQEQLGSNGTVLSPTKAPTRRLA
jgi:hypothetical protein